MTSAPNILSSDSLAPSRRDVAKYGAATAISAATISASRLVTADTATVSGTVYENRSGTLRRQASDPGIAGVLVSNGLDVVRTNSDGRYTLPIDDESVAFVIKPTSYAVPVGEDVLPFLSPPTVPTDLRLDLWLATPLRTLICGAAGSGGISLFGMI